MQGLQELAVCARATRDFSLHSRPPTMDASPSTPNGAAGAAALSPQSPNASKRPRLQTDIDGSASKKIKLAPEEPALYSENVRRKLASASRTGQACDRCKERKMKCDPDPVACQPCRQKSLKCFTTDRVTGQSRERGQSDRAENEVSYLRDQLSQYQKRYGPISLDIPPTPYSAFPSPARERHPSLIPLRPEFDGKFGTLPDIPSSTYVGWPTPDNHGLLQKGPIEGTRADLLEFGHIDSGAFDCDIMRDPGPDDIDFFNFSSGSVLLTINQRQSIRDPLLPSKAETLAQAEAFLTVMSGFIPIVHRPSFIDLVHRVYDTPETVSMPEKVQVVQMLAILNHQTAIRNHTQAAKIQDSYRFLHYSLTQYPLLLQDTSLASMQALAMILVHFRNLPKPGLTWTLAQQMLIKAIDQDYHRDPNRIVLPPEESNVLAKELRKRVFHSILGICVTTGCRLGRPAPWQFVQWDVPLPEAIKDSEISIEGLQMDRSGQCEFWQCLQLARLLPLYTELNKYILSVRRNSLDYMKIVEALKTKVDAWRTEWDVCIANEDPSSPHIIIATLLVDSWAAEFLLTLHHPSVCTSRAPEILERNLELCHKAAKRMLSNFHKLAKHYKAADFTWHCTVAYALGFGTTLHIYRKRAGQLSQEQYDAMKNEFAGWMSVMAYADLVLRTNNHLQKSFDPLVKEVQAYCGEFFSGRQPIDAIANTNGSPFTHVNPNGSAVKPEKSPQLIMVRPQSSQDFSSQQNGNHDNMQMNNGLVPLLQTSHVFHPSIPSFSTTTYQNIPATTAYPISPNAASFPPLPVSLAPLLNEPSPGDMSVMRYRQLTPVTQQQQVHQQDVSMMFYPQIYTDDAATSTWPVYG